MATSVEDEVKQLDVNKETSYLESFIKSKCRLSEKSPNVYIPLSRTTFDGELWLKKVEVGTKDKSKREKVIMMVGATGSGKTTTINAMFNYIMGVQIEDKFRLQLIEEDDEDQTRSKPKSYIAAYTIHHQPDFKTNCTVTIIDTPGFGDTAGIIRDIEIMWQIKTFFSTEGFDGIDMLDAVGFVVPSDPPWLTPGQRYIFDSVLSLFGKDIKDNIFMFCTFAGSGKKPPGILDAVKEAKIPHSGYFKFNHEGLYSLYLDEEEIKSLNIFWNLGWTNFRNFFNRLGLVEPKSLQMTKEVLLERSILEDVLINIQENIMLGVNELEKLNKEKKVLEKYQQEIDGKKHIEYQVNEQFTELADVPDGFTAVNCKTCNVTCLKTRYPWKNSNLEDCFLFREVSGKAHNAECQKCPLKCEWKAHKCEKKYYITKIKRITKTVGQLILQLQESYKDDRGKKMTAEQTIKECQERIDQVGDETVKLIEKARTCIEKLDRIALMPDPVSTDGYIDLIIEAEEAIARDDREKRIQALMQLKERQEVRRNIAVGKEKILEAENKTKHNLELLGERNVIFKTTELDAGQSTVTMKLEEESKSVNWRLFSSESNSLDDRGELFVKGKLEDQHLRNLSDRITDHRSLRVLGGALKLPPHKISSSIGNNRHRYTEAAYELLRIWFIDKENPFVAWEELNKALEKAEMKMFKWEVLK